MQAFIENFNLSFINNNSLYIYLALALCIIIMMIVFVLKLINLNKAVSEVSHGVDNIVGGIESSQIKADAVMHGTQAKADLVLKTLSMYHFLRYVLNKDNREFAKRMHDYQKHQENQKRAFKK